MTPLGLFEISRVTGIIRQTGIKACGLALLYARLSSNSVSIGSQLRLLVWRRRAHTDLFSEISWKTEPNLFVGITVFGFGHDKGRDILNKKIYIWGRMQDSLIHGLLNRVCRYCWSFIFVRSARFVLAERWMKIRHKKETKSDLAMDAREQWCCGDNCD